MTITNGRAFTTSPTAIWLITYLVSLLEFKFFPATTPPHKNWKAKLERNQSSHSHDVRIRTKVRVRKVMVLLIKIIEENTARDTLFVFREWTPIWAMIKQFPFHQLRVWGNETYYFSISSFKPLSKTNHSDGFFSSIARNNPLMG